MDQIRLKRDCEGLSTINYKGPSTVPSMISSPAPDLVLGKSGPGKLGPSPIWRQIRPHVMVLCKLGPWCGKFGTPRKSAGLWSKTPMQFYILHSDLTNLDIFMCIGEYKSVEFIYGIE